MTKQNCSKCGSIKTGSYIKESWCGVCVNARKKQLRIEKRLKSDLPPYGSGRDPKCKDCRKIKEEPYKNGNYCRECKCLREKLRYEEKKKKLGILTAPPRKGRNPICKCGKKKENIKEGSCNKCINKRKRLAYLKKKGDPKYLELYNSENIKKSEERISKKMKLACRIETRRLIFKGILKYAPCEICGTDKDIQCHHDDYMKPLDVRWLCRKHHVEYHNSRKEVLT